MPQRPTVPFVKTVSKSWLYLLAGLVGLPVCTLVGLPACTPPPAPKSSAPITPVPRQQVKLSDSSERVQAAFSVSSGSLGPRLASVKNGWALAWASPLEEGGYQLLTSHVAGNQVSAPQPVVRFKSQLSQLLVDPLGSEGFSVLAVGKSDALDVLAVVQLGPEGELRVPERLIQSTPEQIVWAQAQPITSQFPGQLIFWAEKNKNVADLYFSTLKATGPGRATQVRRNVSAWQLARVAGRPALVTVARSEQDPAAYVIEVRLFDGGSNNEVEPIRVHQLSRGALDIDMVALDQGLVVAWTEPEGTQSRLRVARIDLSAARATVGYALPPRGDQTLRRLLATSSGVQVIWEEPLLSAAQERNVWFGAVTSDATPFAVQPLGRLSSRADDSLLPLFAADQEQLVMVAEGQLCKGPLAEPCVRSERGPSQRFVSRFDVRATASATVLSDLIAPHEARATWEVQCKETAGPGRAACVALVADGATPSGVYLVDLPTAKASKLSAPYQPISTGVAHEVSREVVRPVPELSGLVAERFSDHTVLSWLSYFDPNEPLTASAPAPDGRRDPIRATLGTEALALGSALNLSVQTSSTISLRARSWGGVDLAARGKEGLLAWAALDQEDPQLFATLVDEQGRKLKQKMLTRTDGEVFDVSVTAVESGWAVAWVDGRGGHEEVWVMHVDPRLETTAPLQVSTGAVSPSGVVLKKMEDRLVIAWADGRLGSTDTQSAIYVAVVDQRAQTLVAHERPVTDAKGAAYAPALGLPSGLSGQLLVAYLGSSAAHKDAHDQAHLTFGSLQYLTLDKKQLMGATELVSALSHAVAAPSVGAFALDCSERCRAALTVKRDAVHELWLAELDPKAGQPTQLTTLNGSSPEATAPFLLGSELFYSDLDRPGGSYQLMRSSVAWHSK